MALVSYHKKRNNMNIKPNEKVEAIAKKVIKQAGLASDEKFGSVIAILMMISIILTVIRVLQECNKKSTSNMTCKDKSLIYAENIRLYSKKRGWFTKTRIKRIVKRELLPEDYNKYGIKLTEALLDIGESLTDDEAYTLVEAANV